MPNVLSISTPEHVKALWLSLGLSLVSTVICLVLAYPLAMILRNRGIGQGSFIVFHLHSSDVDELSAAHPGMADSSGERAV